MEKRTSFYTTNQFLMRTRGREGVKNFADVINGRPLMWRTMGDRYGRRRRRLRLTDRPSSTDPLFFSETLLVGQAIDDDAGEPGPWPSQCLLPSPHW